MQTVISEQQHILVHVLREGDIPVKEISKLTKLGLSTVYTVLGRSVYRGPASKNEIRRNRRAAAGNPPPRPREPLPKLTAEQIAFFEERIDKTPGQGPQGTCWTWTGMKTGNNNQYGCMMLPGKHKISVRAVSFQRFFGRNPEGPIGLTCKLSLCINPHHLLELKDYHELGVYNFMSRKN